MKIHRGSVWREQQILELMAALNSSLNLKEVFSRAHPLLSRLLVVDCAALCVSTPGTPGQYVWPVLDKMPLQFFDHYPIFAPEDFVRLAVVKQPNTVLRDSEMVSREELKRSSLYAHCRAMNLPLEHVMAVLLQVEPAWHGGLTLYREDRRPFSDMDRTFLQRLAPVLAHTMLNCKRLSDVEERRHILEALYHHEGFDSVVLIHPVTELLRTGRVNELVQRWFSPLECGRHGLPTVWLERLEQFATAKGLALVGQDIWERAGQDMSLRVTFIPLPAERGRQPWALLLQEVMHVVAVPSQWREKLTKRQCQVVEGVLRGWDNKSIAEELKCSPNTLKTHLKEIYTRLVIASRPKLISAASELNIQERRGRGRRRQ